MESRGYDAFAVRVEKKRDIPKVEKNPSMDKTSKALMEIQDELQKYPNVQVGIGRISEQSNFHFEVEMPTTEKRTDEIKQKITSVARKFNIEDYPIKIYKFNLQKRNLENRWNHVFTSIAEGLMAKEEYNVKGVGYKATSNTMNLYITMSLNSTDPDVKKITKKIEDHVQQFLTSDEAIKAIGDDNYNIVIRSKDKKKMN
jgi:hypothetical protein